MLFHKKCGHPVKLNVGEAYLIEGNTSIGDGALQVNSLNITFRGRKTEKFPAMFNCSLCGEDVPPTELQSSCVHCFEALPVEELFRIEGYPGVYCKDCIEALVEEISSSLDSIKVKPLISSLATFKLSR